MARASSSPSMSFVRKSSSRVACGTSGDRPRRRRAPSRSARRPVLADPRRRRQRFARARDGVPHRWRSTRRTGRTRKRRLAAALDRERTVPVVARHADLRGFTRRRPRFSAACSPIGMRMLLPGALRPCRSYGSAPISIYVQLAANDASFTTRNVYGARTRASV
jgi:hypothetical protein